MLKGGLRGSVIIMETHSLSCVVAWFEWKTPLITRDNFYSIRIWLFRCMIVRWDDVNRLSNGQVTGYVEKAQALLSVYDVDVQAATAAVSHARGEIAIAKLSIRKSVEGVNKAEEEERYAAADVGGARSNPSIVIIFSSV